MNIAIAQIDTRVGDLDGNRARIRAAVLATRDAKVDLVVFPELVLTGYPPRDLLFDQRFVDAALAATEQLACDLRGAPAVIVGTIARAMSPPAPGHPGLLNAAAVLRDGRVSDVRAKRLLPAYDVFHEPRWFVPGASAGPITIGARRVGVLICEDLWDEGHAIHPASELVAQGADLLVCLAASPFRHDILARREHHARRVELPVVYVNAVGANDELIFDGGSFHTDRRGQVVHRLPRFAELVSAIDCDAASGDVADPLVDAEATFRALTIGVRGFFAKNGLRHAFLGLSGGVDSALVACLAQEALGAQRVTALCLPSRFTDPRSVASAKQLAAALGIACEVLPIEPLHAAAEALLAPVLGDDRGVARENVQARLRMLVLMAWVNRHAGVLLNTSNKTELSVGYGTLHGDLAGTLSVIGDLTKQDVYDVMRWYDSQRHVVPRFILERAPTAELRALQIDPFDYPRFAPLVEQLVRGEHVSSAEADQAIALIRAAESKRWQHGIVLKVSDKSFGTGRMMPVTRGGS